MKRFFIPLVAAALHAGVCLAADLDIHMLHSLSNTMDHSEFLQMAIQHDSLTRSITTQQWYDEIGIASDDTLNRLMLPTLYDLIANEYCNRSMAKRDSVVQAWKAFHQHDRSSLPRLYIARKTKNYIRQDTLYAMYDAEPDTWERGYILSQMSDYRNPRVYRYVSDYLQRFPASPFAPNILRSKHRCEQIEVFYSLPDKLRSTDSVVIEYSNTNAHEIVFELYRLPDKWPKKGNGLVKTDSVRVTTDRALIFEEEMQACRMAPQPYGRYFVYARLPEDSLQTPVDSLKAYKIFSNSFFVSDLRVFGLYEECFGSVRPWNIVVDARTGEPVRKAKVKWDHQLPRRTNANGEATFREKTYYSHAITLRKGDDKYHQTSLYAQHGYAAEEGELHILTNATIFRPGDTLQLTVIGTRRNKYQPALLGSRKITLTMHGNDYLLDTMLRLDEDASASLSIPLTDDMRRGFYSLFAELNSTTKKSFHAYGYAYIRLENYRLPTFSLCFDDSCATMQRDRLTPVTGKAVRTNGLPMAGASVTAEVRCHDSYKHYILDSINTDNDGVFRFTLPDEIKDDPDNRRLSVKASLTAPDGETRDANLYISLLTDHTADVVPPSAVTGVPKDSLLWLPSDSMVIRGRDVSLRLGVPRSSWVYCVTSNRNRLLSHTWQQLDSGMHTYSFVLPDTPDDYLDIRFVTTDAQGEHVACYRQLPGVCHTELHIVPATMRDYLTPDAQETWTFRLTDAQGQPVQGRMVMSMTDKALEELHSSRWPGHLFPRWQMPYTQIAVPMYLSGSEHITSRLPFSAGSIGFFPPVLYEPYRIDSARLVLVTGKVVDADGEPVIGAAVMEKGTKSGTVSDYDGFFHLAVHPGAVIECQYIGMKSAECPAYSNMYIVMQEDTEALSEVVVTGYGTPIAGVQIRGVGSVKLYAEKASRNNVYEVEALAVCEEEEDLSAAMPEESNTSSVPFREGDTRLAFYLPSLKTDANGEVQVHFLTPPDNTEWLVQAMAWSGAGVSDYMSRTLMARRTLMLRLQLPRYMRHEDMLHIPCVVSNTADTARQTTVTITIRDAATDSLVSTQSTAVQVPAAGSQTLFFPYTATRNSHVIVTAKVQDSEGVSDGERRLLQVLPLDEPVRECVPFYMRAIDTVVTVCLPQPDAAQNRSVELMLCEDPYAYIAAQLPAEIDSSAVTVNRLAHNLYAVSLRNKLAESYPSIGQTDFSYLVTEIKKYQRSGGAFSWLKKNNSYASEYLTMQVLSLLGELQQFDALDRRLNYTKRQAVEYIDKAVLRAETEYRKSHHDSLPDYHRWTRYAYVRALCPEKMSEDNQRIFHAILDAMYTGLNPEELTTWPLWALTFERAGQHDRALNVINGLRRYAMVDEAHGMYWNNLPDRWWWYRQADIQASFLLAFRIIDPQPAELDAMRQWLILNNRTTDWGKSSLHAFVSYALLYGMSPDESSSSIHSPLSTLPLPDTTTCYTLRRHAERPAWGALMSRYTAPADRLQPFGTRAMKIERRYERVDTTLPPSAPLAKGDRIRVTLTITTDREMDHIILTDRRPALLEPMGMSSYGWIDGTLYYREVRNAEECFYVEHVRRGTTVLTYDCYVTATGTTLAGLATAVSDLAPEFTAHTGSDRIETE